MTKKFLYRSVAVFFSALLITACSRHGSPFEKETVEIQKTESLESVYGCTNVSLPLSIATSPIHSNLFFLVNDQESFNRLDLGASCSPGIDFNKYMLLIGNKGLTSGYSAIDYELKKKTTGTKDSLLLNVTFTLNDAAVAAGATWHVLMPKQPNNIPVRVDFSMKR